MGWTSTTLPWGIKLNDYFKDMFECDNDKVTRKILASSLVKFHTWYAAVEITRKDTGQRDVIAAVVLVHMNPKSNLPLSYREMTEDCGPGICECPEKILKLLTPTTSKSAIDWRKRCWDRIKDRKSKPKLKKGQYLVLDRPLSFGAFGEYQILYIAIPKKGYYQTIAQKGSEKYCKITRTLLSTLDYQVIDLDNIQYKDLPLYIGRSSALDHVIGQRLNDSKYMEAV